MQTVTDFEVYRRGQTEKVTIFVRDTKTGDLTDVVGTSNFSLIDIADDAEKVSQDFTSSGTGVVAHTGTGIYEYTLNTSIYNSEYLAAFRCVLDGEISNINKYVQSVPTKYFKYAAILRPHIDKSRKNVSDEIENMDREDFEPSSNLFYGYDDKHLIYYLERGVQVINAVPPYTILDLSSFPFSQYGAILQDAAVIAALEAQGIFAIDTDYDYSLGGNSFTIDHFSKINAFLGTLLQRFSDSVKPFKQMFRTKGGVLYQYMPGGIRTARTLNAMPTGFWSRVWSAFMT